MVKREVRTPIHMHVVGFVGAPFLVAGHKNEFFFHQPIDRQTWPMLRRIHNRCINDAARDKVDQILWHVNVDAQGNVSQRFAHPEHPIEQKRLP